MELLLDRQLILAENAIMETPRLTLRPVTLADAEDMYDYAHDREAMQFVFEPHQTLEDTKRNIANYFLSSPLGKFGIELKATGHLIGSIDLNLQEAHENGVLGYVLHPDYWGQGIIAEAGEALLALAFDKLRLIRVSAVHDVLNPNSGKVMTKLGMTFEGRLPNARKWKGKVVTDQQYGITKEVWEARHV